MTDFTKTTLALEEIKDIAETILACGSSVRTFLPNHIAALQTAMGVLGKVETFAGDLHALSEDQYADEVQADHKASFRNCPDCDGQGWFVASGKEVLEQVQCLTCLGSGKYPMVEAGGL